LAVQRTKENTKKFETLPKADRHYCVGATTPGKGGRKSSIHTREKAHSQWKKRFQTKNYRGKEERHHRWLMAGGYLGRKDDKSSRHIELGMSLEEVEKKSAGTNI